MNDDVSWQELCKSVKPLVKTRVCTSMNNVHFVRKKKVFSYTLDLHGYTIQEAYDTLLKFIEKHYTYKTKHVTVICGKGNLNKEGLIHKEICNWLTNNSFSIYVRSFEWINGNGALKVYLRK